MRKSFLHILYVFFFLIGCQDEGEDLPSVEERKAIAKAELISALTTPANGWILHYQPTPDAGTFLMLLDFEEDGRVRIQSDVVENEGEFFDQTITYRIDNQLGTELIFETYAVFHYLFDLEAASFGGEFEFFYTGREEENLIFESKSDLSNPTVITLEPAAPDAADAFAREIAQNLNTYGGRMPDVFEVTPPIQQVVFEDLGLSLFWALDPTKRNIRFDMIGSGTTYEELLANNDFAAINHETGYSMTNGKLVLNEPVTFSFAGTSIALNEITLNTFELTGQSLCTTGAENNEPKYSGQVEDLGAVTLLKSYFSGNNAGFQSGNVYSVNAFFLFDGDGNSLSETGVLAQNFPEVPGFVIFYGAELTDEEIPIYSVGFILEDDALFLREFEPVTSFGNKTTFSFTDSYYHSGTPAAGDTLKLSETLNTLFEGKNMYAFDFSQEGILKLYNPCNQYELFLAY